MLHNIKHRACSFPYKSILDKTRLIVMNYFWKNFFHSINKDFRAVFAFTFIKEIGRQFSRYVPSLPFSSKRVIIACFAS